MYFEDYRSARNNWITNFKSKEFPSISIYPSQNGEKLFIRYKVDGEQISGVELGTEDKIFYEKALKMGTKEEKEAAKLYLAEKYFLKELSNMIDRSQGVQR